MTVHEFVWLDIEATGLNPFEGELLEWAIVFADDGPGGTFEKVDAYSSAVAHPNARDLAHVDPYVINMHDTSGLWAACADHSAPTLDACEAFLIDLLHDKAPKGELTIAGSSPHFDLAWLRVHMPKVAKRFSHRVFDVSTLQRAFSTYHDTLEASQLFAAAPAHRAMGDIEYSLYVARATLARTGWKGAPQPW